MEALMEALLQVVLLKEVMMLEEVLVALSSLSLSSPLPQPQRPPTQQCHTRVLAGRD